MDRRRSLFVDIDKGFARAEDPSLANEDQAHPWQFTCAAFKQNRFCLLQRKFS